MYNQDWPTICQKGYDVRVFKLGFNDVESKVKKYLKNHYNSNTKKIIVMEDFISRKILSSIPKSKIVLFMWEPIGKTSDSAYYSSVYTFNDDLVGSEKYRKFVYPQLMPLTPNPKPFEDKKMCTAVISHWLPERVRLVNFFKEVHPDSFDLFGNKPGPFKGTRIYKGRIPGHHSASPKLKVLRNYKFVFAFENSACPRYNIVSGYCAPGYITEKIFGIFASGAIPIYLGPENIEQYIPKNCFIPYSDFSSDEELYFYLSNMSKDVYEQYLQNIRAYLQHEQAHVFSPKAFEKTILEAVES